MSERFERQVTVRFRDVDRAQIAYFGEVFNYCHVVYEELMTEVVGGLEAFFAESGWGMPLVHAEADFRRPNRLGDELTVSLAVERLGQRSVTFAFEVRAGDEVRAKVQHVHAFVDLARFEALDAPEAFVEGLQRLGLIS